MGVRLTMDGFSNGKEQMARSFIVAKWLCSVQFAIRFALCNLFFVP